MTSRTGMLLRLASATLLFIGVATSASAHITPAPTAAELECVALANQSRAAEGLAPLQWDSALAAAARFHAQRMSQEGPISHRYGGEPGLAERAASAGARFSLVEENIAIGESPAQIHDAWMHSPGHHDNLLNRQIDRIGVAIVQARGVLYAVADYAQAVAALTRNQVEAKVAAIVAAHGLAIETDASSAEIARQYCVIEDGSQASPPGVERPRFMMRWQGDVGRLPGDLSARLASGMFSRAAIGACAPQHDPGSSQAAFTAYRVAVLLY